MSLEVFGDGGDGFDDFDAMIRHGWEFDENMEKARKEGDDEWIPIDQAIGCYIEWMSEDDGL